MTLIRNGAVIKNPWRLVADDEEISGDEAVIVSLKRWQDEKKKFLGRNGPLGIRLESNQKPDNIAGDVERFELPGFNAYNFFMTEALGGGGTGSVRADAQGKSLAQLLLSVPIKVPVGLM